MRHGARLLAVGLVVPMLAAVALVWSVSDRLDQLDQVPVAIVNDDQIVTQPSTVAAGRALASALMDPDDSDGSDVQLAWTLTDADDASRGLRSGDYYAVLTVPEDFSTSLVSTGTDSPVSGRLGLESNAAASATLPYLSRTVVAAAADALGEQSTQGYLKNVYGGFNQLADSTSQAASSASELAGGAAEVASGAENLDEGADSLASGTSVLVSGAQELLLATGSLRRGSQEVARGAQELRVGARSLAGGAGALARSSQQLARRGGDFAGRAREVARVAGLEARGAERHAEGALTVSSALVELRRRCVAAGAELTFCAELDLLSARGRVLAAGAGLLARGSQGLARANDALAGGAAALAAGERELAQGARRLRGAGDELARSAGRLASGAASVASGAAEVDQATGELVGGAQSTETAADELAGGSATLSSGARSTDQGAGQLSDGLAKEAKASPTYTDAQQDALAATVSQPVVLTSTVEHADRSDAWLVAAIVALVLWLGALAATVGVAVDGGRRHALTSVSSRRIAVVQAAPVLGLALLQATGVLAALALLRVDLASAAGFAGLTVLATVCFAVVAHAVRLSWGWLGVAVLVLLLLLQVAALGNVLPLETAPALLRSLNSVLPLTAYTDAASQLVSGGDVGSPVVAVLVVLAWTLAAALLALRAVKRMRLRVGLLAEGT